MAPLALAVFGCVRFDGLPDMPAGTASDPAVYASESKVHARNVMRARHVVRSANVSWVLRGTAGERFASAREIRRKFGGVIFVGDSQIREVAWAALQMLAPGQAQAFAREDRVFGGSRRRVITSSCVPQSVGKTGFTAACGPNNWGLTAGAGGGAGGGATGGASGRSSSCLLYSPFPNKTYAEKMRKLLLTRPHQWDGQLSVSAAACESDFFVSYQATWGAMPVDPTSLPKCLHLGAADAARDGAATTDGSYGLRHRRSGAIKPILWIVDGCGLHEMEFCDPRRWRLPQAVLPKFTDRMLRSSLVWQTVGGGFLMRAARRFKGECAAINADEVAAVESRWLSSAGVRHVNYSRVALQYAPLMIDAIHFTYYWVPCPQTFPELARLAAQLSLNSAVGRPIEVCPPGTPNPPSPRAPSDVTPPAADPFEVRAASAGGAAAARAAGHVEGVPYVVLSQTAEQAQLAYDVALRIGPGKAAGAPTSAAAGGGAARAEPGSPGGKAAKAAAKTAKDVAKASKTTKGVKAARSGKAEPATPGKARAAGKAVESATGAS